MPAGTTWTLVIANAPWAARYLHTTVIDSAGAIYVLGGGGGTEFNNTVFNDVWASANQGARVCVFQRCLCEREGSCVGLRAYGGTGVPAISQIAGAALG